MPADLRIKLLDLIMCLSNAMDFIDPTVVSHHKQVAYVASCIAEEMGLSVSDQKDLLLAGALHDIGAFPLKQREDIIRYEVDCTAEYSEAGYAILSAFAPLSYLAPIVRYHHEHWDNGKEGRATEMPVPYASHVLHLADCAAALVNKKSEVLRQVPSICRAIRSKSGSMFHPEMVDAFLNLSSKEYFWFEIVSPQSTRLSLKDLMDHQSPSTQTTCSNFRDFSPV